LKEESKTKGHVKRVSQRVSIMEFPTIELKKRWGLGLNINTKAKMQDSFFGNIDPNVSYITNNQTFFHANKTGTHISKSSVCKLNNLTGVGLS